MKFVTLLVVGGLLLPTTVMAQQISAPSAAAGAAIMGVGLNVTDIDRSLKYYTEGLGMLVAASIGTPENRETFLGFDSDGTKPRLMLLSGTAAKAAIGAGASGFGRIVVKVSDVTPIQARIRAAGYQAGDITSAASGHHVLIVYDPDGYRLEFVAAPPGKP